MTTQPPLRVMQFLPMALILIILGWGGFYFLIVLSEPSGGTRWLFFFSLAIALTGTLLLPIAFINRRFTSTPPATQGVIIRQSLWAGVYIPALLWLQIGCVLSIEVATLLGIGIILIEWLLRMRERSQWKP